jgi:hypothetical protein
MTSWRIVAGPHLWFSAHGGPLVVQEQAMVLTRSRYVHIMDVTPGVGQPNFDPDPDWPDGEQSGEEKS